MSYERTPYGQRLREARLALNLTQADVAKAVGMSQSTLAELEKSGLSSGQTAQLARLYDVDAHWLATGEMQAQEAPPRVGNSTWRTPRKQGVSARLTHDTRPDDHSPIVPWESLVSKNLPRHFSVICQDESMSPFLRRGSTAHFERDLQPGPGDVVLIEDTDQRFYVRMYRQRRNASWEGYPLNDLFQSLHSDQDDATIVAVFVGMAGRTRPSD